MKASSISANESDGFIFDFTDDDFDFIAGYIHNLTGIFLQKHKKNMVYSRLTSRLRRLGFEKFSQYVDYIKNNANDAELSDLINSLTTNLTSFFRENHHFDFLKQHFNEVSTQGTDKFRIWSAGCSMGCEPYTIAMCVNEYFKNFRTQNVKILATDLDTEVLKKGREGKYPKSDADNIPENFKKKYFTQEGDNYTAKACLKELITYNQLNLMGAWPMKGQFDIIFCRNVIIYFEKATQAKLVGRYADLLKPGGYLFLGHSENLAGKSERFEACGQTIYRKIR